MIVNLDYDLHQAVELLDNLISNWDKVVKHLKDSRRISIYRCHMQEVCIQSFYSISPSICNSSFYFIRRTICQCYVHCAVLFFLVGSKSFFSFQPSGMDDFLIRYRVFVVPVVHNRQCLEPVSVFRCFLSLSFSLCIFYHFILLKIWWVILIPLLLILYFLIFLCFRQFDLP